MFYFISWVGWIFTTFFMNKNKNRLKLSLILFVLIILSKTTVEINFIQYNFVGIFLFLIGLFLITKEKSWKILLILYSGIIGMIYCIFNFFVIHYPVVIMVPQQYILVAILCICCYMFEDNFKRVVSIFLFGTFQGDLMLRHFLYEFEGVHQVGDMAYLEIIILGLVIFFMFHFIGKFISNNLVKKQYYEKGTREL